VLTFEADSADEVWRLAAHQMSASAPVQESRDQQTRELLHVAFTIRDPRQRVVFARPINPAFAIAEVIWILAGSNDLEFLRFWNPRMQRFSDDGVMFHGAYGFRLGSQPALSDGAANALRHIPSNTPADRRDQLRAAYDALQQTPHSRQIVLQIWDSRLDLPSPLPRSKDIPCNLMSHLLIRNDKLDWLQVMRSNDLVWGTPYNFIQFTTIQEVIAGWLGIEVGTYSHISDSLHVYERHWSDLDSLIPDAGGIPRNTADLRVPTYQAWESLWRQIVDTTILMAHATSSRDIIAIAEDVSHLPSGYCQWIWLLAAEALRRRDYGEMAREVVHQAGPFWSYSWNLWTRQVSSSLGA
jgi:thymidylate synthase